jgi:glutamate/tyrosine decarboxylase-like PLP-dependent enzyme
VAADFRADQDTAATEPFSRSLAWSRGFTGLKLLLSLAVVGWAGYRDVLRRQLILADRLRQRLVDDGWTLANQTPLPVVCFTGGADDDRSLLDRTAAAVNASGEARIFVVRVGGQHVLRACVTNYATTAADIDLLAGSLARARAQATAARADGQPTAGASRAGGGCGA